jgi:hypothetical protein
VNAERVLEMARARLASVINAPAPRSGGAAGGDHGSKRRKTAKGDVSLGRGGSKGLRHFSLKVCEKVEAKGRTTYNEVADELVDEMSRTESMKPYGLYDEKNIRRRVYDAINVLMAMDIIQKEKKEILWKGELTGCARVPMPGGVRSDPRRGMWGLAVQRVSWR